MVRYTKTPFNLLRSLPRSVFQIALNKGTEGVVKDLCSDRWRGFDCAVNDIEE